MKKISLASTLLIVSGLLASCTSEERIEAPAPADIRFEVANDEFNVQSRATSMTASGLVGKNFNLFGTGVPGASPFNHKMKVNATTGNGSIVIDETTPPTYYWPATTPAMNFFAVYPHMSSGWTAFTESSTALKRSYTIETTAFGSTTDLLVAYQSVDAKMASIPLNFKHALTKVTFTLTLTNTSAATVYVKSVEMSNLKITRPFELTAASYTALGTGATIGTSTGTDLAAGPWNGAATGTGSLTTGTLTQGTQAKVFTTGSTQSAIFGTANANDHFIVMPVDGHPAAVKLDVVFSVNGLERPLSTTLPAGTDETKMWKAGRHINYELQYNLDENKLLFGGITVEGWGTMQNIPVPIN